MNIYRVCQWHNFSIIYLVIDLNLNQGWLRNLGIQSDPILASFIVGFFVEILDVKSNGQQDNLIRVRLVFYSKWCWKAQLDGVHERLPIYRTQWYFFLVNKWEKKHLKSKRSLTINLNPKLMLSSFKFSCENKYTE